MPRSSTTPSPQSWLRYVRERDGILARDLAEAVGVAVGTYSRIESGQRAPSLRVARALAVELQVPERLLFPQDDDPSLEEVVNADIAKRFGKRYAKKRKAKR